MIVRPGKRLSAGIALMLCIAGGCHVRPAARPALDESGARIPADRLPFELSAMRIEHLPGIRYYFARFRTSRDAMAAPIAQVEADLRQTIVAGQLKAAGDLLVVLHDPSEDAAKPFNWEVGLPVEGVATSAGIFGVRDLPAFHCATITYSGPARLLDRGIDALIARTIAAGYVPDGTIRERFANWQTQSPGRIEALIELGIE